MEALTIPALRRAIETRDGRTAAYCADLCGRTMTHRVDAAVALGDRLAVTQTCTYPEGDKVVCAAMLELSDGRIERHLAVQAWDP